MLYTITFFLFLYRAPQLSTPVDTYQQVQVEQTATESVEGPFMEDTEPREWHPRPPVQ